MWFLATWAKRLSWQEVARALCTSWDHVFRSVAMAVAWGRDQCQWISSMPIARTPARSTHHGGNFLTLSIRSTPCAQTLAVDRPAPTRLERVVAHEGSHIQDDFRYVNSGFDQMFNPTHGETEFRAFVVGAIVAPYVINAMCGDRPCAFRFGPRDVTVIRDYLLRSNQYGRLYNTPVFQR
jgi:hypothetical protein